MLYEESMPVVVRRRGVTMTVRIFGADDDDVINEAHGDDEHYHDQDYDPDKRDQDNELNVKVF